MRNYFGNDYFSDFDNSDENQSANLWKKITKALNKDHMDIKLHNAIKTLKARNLILDDI